MRKKVVITGSGGFIGSNLVPKVAARHGVVALGHDRCDLLKPASFQNQLKNVEAVVHLAGLAGVHYSITNPAEVIHKNLAMCLNLLEAIRVNRQHPLFIFASTDRIYGKPTPLEPYVASKIMGETAIQIYGRLYDIPYIILRLDAAYGPNQPRRMFLSDVIQKMIAQDEIVVGNLGAYRNFIHVDDVADVFLRALKSSPKAQNAIYDVGGRQCVSLRRALGILKKTIEKKMVKKITVRVDSKLLERQAQTEMAIPFKLSINKTAQYLGWRPKFNLETGLADTVNWFMKNVQ